MSPTTDIVNCSADDCFFDDCFADDGDGALIDAVSSKKERHLIWKMAEKIVKTARRYRSIEASSEVQFHFRLQILHSFDSLYLPLVSFSFL